MTRGELGSHPLLVEIIKKGLCYINNVKTRLYYFAHIALRVEYANDISPNITKFVDRFEIEGRPDNSTSKFKIKKMCLEHYDKIWKS